MQSAPASRAVLRQGRLFLQRNNRTQNFRQASTAAETAAKAKETASETVSKASEGLSRVQSSAGSAVSTVSSGVGSALSGVGGRTGRMIKFVESLIPPTIYYSRVGLELGRIMFRGQQMTPPSISQIQGYFTPLTNAIRHPQTIVSSFSRLVGPEGVVATVRNMNNQQLAALGVAGAEILGFFTVGTMIGRMKVVGYHGAVHHEH